MRTNTATLSQDYKKMPYSQPNSPIKNFQSFTKSTINSTGGFGKSRQQYLRNKTFSISNNFPKSNRQIRIFAASPRVSNTATTLDKYALRSAK